MMQAKQDRTKSGLMCLPHLSFIVADLLIELFALQAQEVLVGQQDAALGGDGTRRVDVVPSHHAHSDTCPLALGNGLRHLLGDKEQPWHHSPPSVQLRVPTCSSAQTEAHTLD